MRSRDVTRNPNLRRFNTGLLGMLRLHVHSVVWFTSMILKPPFLKACECLEVVQLILHQLVKFYHDLSARYQTVVA